MDFDPNEKDLGKVLASILTGNVDRSFLDSGGIYGTAQGHNKKMVDASGLTAHEFFQGTVESLFKVHEWRDGDLELRWTHNVYWWLQRIDGLKYQQELTAKFYDFVDFLYAHGNKGSLPNGKTVSTNYGHGARRYFQFAHSFWPDESQDWEDMDYDEWRYRYDVFTAWFEVFGKDELFYEYYARNTYNGDCMLSQDIHYVAVNYDDVWYVIVSIHGGADLRSGYHDCIIFSYDDEPYLSGNQGSIYCNSCHANWDTWDAGYHIHGNGDAPDIDNDFIIANAERNEVDEVTGRLLCPCCTDGVLNGGF